MKHFASFTAMAFVAATLALSACSGEKVENPVLLSKAAELGAKGDWQGARKLAQKAVKQDANDADALVLLSLSLENSGDLDSAIDEINKAIKINERNFMANYTKGRLLLLKGKYESCIAPLKQARTLRPESLEATTLLAQAAMRQNLSEASGYYGMLAKSERFKNRPEPWNEIGVFYAGRKDLNKALSFLVKAESLAPDSPQVAINLAIVNDYASRPADAVSYYKKYLKLTAKNPSLESKRQAVADRVRELSGQ